MTIPDTVFHEWFGYLDRANGITKARIVTVSFKVVIVVARDELSWDLSGKVAKLRGHGVTDAVIEALLIHVKPVPEAQNLIAGGGFLTNEGDGLIHNGVLRILMPDVKVG
jgi:hypothetical protein